MCLWGGVGGTQQRGSYCGEGGYSAGVNSSALLSTSDQEVIDPLPACKALSQQLTEQREREDGEGSGRER